MIIIVNIRADDLGAVRHGHVLEPVGPAHEAVHPGRVHEEPRHAPGVYMYIYIYMYV